MNEASRPPRRTQARLVKLAPARITAVPTGPWSGVKLSRMARTVMVPGLAASPEGLCTVTRPVVALAGMVKVTVNAR